VADLVRAGALEAAAGRDVELGLDQVEAGRHLGDRVLDLQPRVDLEEAERLAGGFVEELHGGGALVADRQRQPLRRLLDSRHLLGRQDR
jgi:hypothetical protein